MTFRKLFFSLIIFITASCGENNDNSQNSNTTIQDLKRQKIEELEKIRSEVDSLKDKRDSFEFTDIRN